jgi:uncharacterized protein YkwD
MGASDCGRTGVGRRLIAGVVLLALLALAAPAGATPQGAQAPCDRWAVQGQQAMSREQVRNSILCLINRKRGAARRGSLQRSGALERAAQRHTDRMRRTGCFSHECPGERNLERRVRAAGYLAGVAWRWEIAENIAWARRQATPRSIVSAWLHSRPHRRSMLARRFRDAGVAYAAGAPGARAAEGGTYTVVFGLAARRG